MSAPACLAPSHLPDDYPLPKRAHSAAGGGYGLQFLRSASWHHSNAGLGADDVPDLDDSVSGPVAGFSILGAEVGGLAHVSPLRGASSYWPPVNDTDATQD